MLSSRQFPVLDTSQSTNGVAFLQTGCACMLVLFTAMVAKYGGTTNKVGNGFGVLFLYLYVTFYASCIDAVTYVYCAEIFPTHMRAQGVSAAIIGLFAMTLSKSTRHAIQLQ